MKDMISIIVPVYNTEKFIGRCIESILNQTYTNIELILINDGSKDNSKYICDEYARKDERIKVVHSQNEGVSASRNKGLQIAKGEYVQFVDSDDYIDENMCQTMLRYATNYKADMIICGFKAIDSHQIKDVSGLECYIENTFQLNEYFGLLYDANLVSAVWNKLYKRQLIKSKFIVGLSFAEDLFFNLKYIENCMGIVGIKDILYLYDRTENIYSLSKKFQKDQFNTYITIFEELNNFCNSKHISNKVVIYNSLIIHISDSLQTYIIHFNIKLKAKYIKIRNILENDSIKYASEYAKLTKFENKLVNLLIRIKSPLLIIIFYYLKELVKIFLKKGE